MLGRFAAVLIEVIAVVVSTARHGFCATSYITVASSRARRFR